MKDLFKSLILEFQEKKYPLINKREARFPSIKNKATIIIGPRRAGKTFYLYQIMQEKKINKKDIVCINFDDIRLSGINITKYYQLIDAFFELFPNNKPVFFLDEIQNLDNWENLVITIINKGFEIFITGSNSKLLSKEIATNLSGKSISMKILPYSFKEYLSVKNIPLENIEFSNKKYNAIKEFQNYFDFGGYPEIINNKTFRKEILQTYIDQVIFKDLIERYDLRNNKILDLFVKYSLNNYATEFSIRSFYRFTQSLGIKTSTSVIHHIAKIIEDVFFIKYVESYNYSYKKQQLKNKKMYLIDTAYIKFFTTKDTDKGRVLENIIAIELFRRNEEIYFYIEKNECDFIICTNKRPHTAIQVTYTLNEDSYDREINGVISAMKDLKIKKGIIITMNEEKEITVDNYKIKIIPAWKFLLNNF